MMRMLLIAAMIFLAPKCTMAFEVSFDEFDQSCDVIGAAGASHIAAQAAVDSPFSGGYLNGGAYFDGLSALHAEGFCVVNGARGGAMSFDSNGWPGYKTQVDNVLRWSDWFGVNKLDYGLVSGVNDCWHSGDPRFPCDASDIAETVNNAVTAARRLAVEAGCVLVDDMPDWESLHLAEAMEFYGLTATDKETFEALKAAWYEAFMPLGDEGIHLVFVWSNGSTYPDGLHPPYKDQVKAARDRRQAIKKYCE